MKYELRAETWDWTCQASADKAREYMQRTLDELPADKARAWAEGLLGFREGLIDELPRDLLNALSSAELHGMDGWMDYPATGHTVDVFVFGRPNE